MTFHYLMLLCVYRFCRVCVYHYHESPSHLPAIHIACQCLSLVQDGCIHSLPVVLHIFVLAALCVDSTHETFSHRGVLLECIV
jgi:hypothetical protein